MKRRQGFTLVELVVVIMILGILAGVAAPKFMNTSASATENGLKQTLGTIRNGIEMYVATEGNGALPPSTTSAAFQNAMKPYIRGTFPACPVGNKTNTIATGTTDTPSGSEGWRVNTTTGNFFANTATTDSNMASYATY